MFIRHPFLNKHCGTWISASLAGQPARSLSRSAPEAPPELRPTLATPVPRWTQAKLAPDLFESIDPEDDKNKTITKLWFYFYSCGTWIRTRINGFKGRCPTVRRSRKDMRILLKNNPDVNQSEPASRLNPRVLANRE